MSLSLSSLLETLRDCNEITLLSIPQLLSLFSLVSHLRNRLGWSQRSDSSALPLLLPINVANFLCLVLDINDAVLRKIWQALRPFLAALPEKHKDGTMYDSALHNASLLPLFLEYGLPSGIGRDETFSYTHHITIYSALNRLLRPLSTHTNLSGSEMPYQQEGFKYPGTDRCFPL